jgi:lipopolysaccharide export system permease protein
MFTLYRYILKQHIAPMLLALAIVFFVLMINVVVKNIDLFIGKGIPLLAVAEFFGLSMAWMAALAVPMSVLVAVISAFGRMAADNEITAVKAGGVSLIRLVLPIVVASAVLAAGMVYFNNHALPAANKRLSDLMLSMHRKKPAIKIKEKVFMDYVPGYTIRVEEVDPKTSEVEGVVLLKHQKDRPDQLIVAGHGTLMYREESGTLRITLLGGATHDADPENPGKYRRLSFETQVLNLKGAGSELVRTVRTAKGDREMSTAELSSRVEKEKESISNNTAESAESLRIKLKGYADRAREIQLSGSGYISTDNVLQELISSRKTISTSRTNMNARQARIRQMNVEIHKKFSIPFACIIFVLLGAPIGMRIRLSGFIVGMLVSLSFFVLYYIFLLGGENFGDRGYMSAFWAMWMPNIILGAIGGYMTYCTVTEKSPLRPIRQI